MRTVNVKVQGNWLRRRGIRGRWVSVYIHQYGGQEVTERLHSHPWLLAFGVILKGGLTEIIGEEGKCRRRRFLSVGMYSRKTQHRIVGGDAVTIFVGLIRTQLPIERVAEIHTAQGYCHYTEIMPDERGFNPQFVE